jgi:hypothetical protein
MSKHKTITIPRTFSQSEALPRAKQLLRELQPELLPQHEDDFIALHLESGEYLVGADKKALVDAFRQRWPDVVPFVMRVNGKPVVKFHGK